MEPTAISFTWFDVLKFALGTGVVTAIANQGIAWFREVRKESGTTTRDARYLALRIAVMLEQFSISCADAISENDMYQQSEGYAGRPHGKLPSLSEYPTDADWRSLDPSLAAQIISFRNELLLSDQTIEFWWDVDRETVRGACDEQAGKSGYRAWLIASQLRGRYRLPSFDPRSFAWDVVATLKEHHDRAIKKLVEASKNS